MKAWKITLIIGIIVLAVGLALFITGLALNGWKFKVEYEMETFNSTEENTALDLRMSAGSMNVQFYEGDSIELTYPVSYARGYEVSERAGTVRVNPVNRHVFNWFGWSNIPAVTVKVPEGKVMDLKLETSAGSATVASGAYGDVRIDMSAGAITVGEVVCKNFKADLSAGRITVSSAACTALDVDLSAGMATFDNVVSKDIDIDLSAGTVYMSVKGDKSEYAITVDKSAGSCNLASQSPAQGTAEVKRIDVDLSAGNVEVTFKD